MNMKISEIKITYLQKVNIADAPTINGSSDAYQVLYKNWDLEEIELRESFKILLLNRANKVKGIYTISEGGVAGTVVDAKLIFSVALKTMTNGIILCHNHPSGNLKPSQADRDITSKIRKAAESLDINILDHLILSPFGSYYSFADEGWC